VNLSMVALGEMERFWCVFCCICFYIRYEI